MMINYKHLHYFWEVARHGSIARASEYLHLTPQTISGQISMLEERMGKPLFNKVGRNLELTDTGRLVLSYADEIFSLGSELEETLRNLPSQRPMDFKVAGTQEGITALQMDIKIEGINEEIMRIALSQARDGRNFILGEMNKVLAESRSEMSEWAPRLMTLKVHPDKIRDVIGKGGVTIRSITEETGCTIDIADDGTVTIASVNKEAADEARKRIEQITADIEPGQIFEGKVIKIMNFGAFVSLTPGRDGLVHISQLSNERVENVTDVVKEGDMVKVKVLEVDKQGRIRLSMKAVSNED